MHRESDYAGLETVSTLKLEIKILTLTSCFCKGHLVVNWALVMQVMMCTHYREALQTSTALQQSSSSSFHSFWESGAEICSPGSSEEDAGNISKPAISAHCPCMHTYELQPAVFQNYPFFYFKICTSMEAKILLAVIRRIRKEGAWDLLLDWYWHTWCLDKREDCPNIKEKTSLPTHPLSLFLYIYKYMYI